MSISLDQMATLVRALVDADEEVNQAENNLKAAKEKARILREETIPSAMQELGLESLKLDTGQTVKVQQDVYASIPKAGKQAAFMWLEEHGFGGLIKLTVDVNYGKGEQEAAQALYAQLAGAGLDASLTQDVHAQTLKAFLREQIATGSDIPLDLFGARPIWTAKISSK